MNAMDNTDTNNITSNISAAINTGGGAYTGNIG
jgi:hypothetical protein